MNLDAKYPDCEVELTRADGNAFAIIGNVRGALRRHLRDHEELTPAEITAEADAFVAEATAGDYDHLLQTCMRWVDVT